MGRSRNVCAPSHARPLAQHLHWPARKVSLPRRFLSLPGQCTRPRWTRRTVGASFSRRETPPLAHRLFAPRNGGTHYASVDDERHSSPRMQLGMCCTAIARSHHCCSTFWLLRLPMCITSVWFCRLCPASQPAHLHSTDRRTTHQWLTRQLAA